MWSVELTVGDEPGLAVHRFDVVEGVSASWTADVVVRTADPALDLRPLIGAGARLTVALARPAQRRSWSGIVVRAEQSRAVAQGASDELSEYHFRLAPRLWLATQRMNHRVFQHESVPEIVERVLGSYATLEWKVDRAAHPELEIRVQYGESDFAFASRLLEETGISYAILEEDGESKLVLADAPTSAPVRRNDPIRFDMTPAVQLQVPCVRDVRTSACHRPASRVITDHDFRNPALRIHAERRTEHPATGEQEVHEYRPGGALVERDPQGRSQTPAADDRGYARVDTAFADDRSLRALEADRAGRIEVGFESNQIGLAAGSVFRIEGHPHPMLADELLVLRTEVHGVVPDELRTAHVAVTAAEPYRTPATTPRPQVTGVQSATVTGPRGDEIHVDEYGRVRIRFPWDREGTADETSFCWVRVTEGWAGTGYGMIALPRVGQEVLVAFVAGDPDQPVVVGRMYNQTQPVPYKLPDDKTVSGWRTSSSPASGGYNELKIAGASSSTRAPSATGTRTCDATAAHASSASTT
jgi:type VI secretion system secreted protein VgrG